jgi:hypothetical protein
MFNLAFTLRGCIVGWMGWDGMGLVGVWLDRWLGGWKEEGCVDC